MAAEPTTPSWLVITTLNDRRGGVDKYWSRLADLDVPTPETVIASLNEDGDFPSWEADDILRTMEQRGWDRAFVRTAQKAAPDYLERGSLIHDPTIDEINRTVESLFGQIEMSEWEVGGALILRERLDLSFCLNPNHWMCHPEIRFIIEGGEVLFGISADVGPDSVCSQGYPHLMQTLIEASPPHEAAEVVADEFDELPWAVDFVLDTTGTWYCVELNLNGVRWESESGDWSNMCGHADMEAYSPRVVHGPVLDRISRRDAL